MMIIFIITLPCNFTCLCTLPFLSICLPFVLTECLVSMSKYFLKCDLIVSFISCLHLTLTHSTYPCSFYSPSSLSQSVWTHLALPLLIWLVKKCPLSSEQSPFSWAHRAEVDTWEASACCCCCCCSPSIEEKSSALLLCFSPLSPSHRSRKGSKLASTWRIISCKIESPSSTHR